MNTKARLQKGRRVMARINGGWFRVKIKEVLGDKAVVKISGDADREVSLSEIQQIAKQ
jgi:translation initiation factor IF-1